MKLDFLRTFSEDQLLQLEYRNEDDYQKLRPNKQLIKEIPFLKNNPKQQKALEQNGMAPAADTEVKTERQRKIEELKKNLLAPMIPAQK